MKNHFSNVSGKPSGFTCTSSLKRAGLLVLLTGFCASTAFAQTEIVTIQEQSAPRTDFRKYLQFGLKGGLNYSNVYNSRGESFDANPNVGFAGGAFVVIPIGQLMGIQPEVLLSQKGFTGTGQILGAPYEFERTTTYLDIPVFFMLKPAGMFTFLAGPQYSYLLKKRDVFTNATSTVAQEQEFENDNVRKNTLALVGGIDINMEHLVIGARAGMDLFRNNGDGTSTTPEYKNAWFQVTLGYRFYY